MWLGILWAFLGTCFTFSVTSLGSFNVFFLKNKLNSNTQSVFLGFAGGVMIAASMWLLRNWYRKLMQAEEKRQERLDLYSDLL